MTHLDIVEQTPDRLVLRCVRGRRDAVATALVALFIFAFLGWAVWLFILTGDPLLGLGIGIGVVLIGPMLLLKNRVTMDREADRLAVTRPLAFRFSRLSEHRLQIRDVPAAGGVVAELALGPYVIARTEPHVDGADARAALARDAALVGRYLPEDSAS